MFHQTLKQAHLSTTEDTPCILLLFVSCNCVHGSACKATDVMNHCRVHKGMQVSAPAGRLSVYCCQILSVAHVPANLPALANCLVWAACVVSVSISI